MNRLPEKVLGVVGLALMAIGWTGFTTTIPLSELVSIDNDAEGLSIILVWLQGLLLLVMAVVLALIRRHSRSRELEALRWPWPPAPTAVGVVLVAVVAVMLGPLVAVPLLVAVAVMVIVCSHRGGGGTGSPPWLQVTMLVVMVLAGGYAVVFGAPGIVAHSVELLVASAGLVQPAGVTAPPYLELSLWGGFTVLTVSWVVLLVSYGLAGRRRRAEVSGVVS